MISVLILTKNEQQDLPACLASVNWSDDIHVFDSFSLDKTVEIAEATGAKVTQRAFDNWASHQNWGLKNIPFKYPWVFYIDADERMTPELVTHVKEAVKIPGDKVAFRVQRRDFFMGRWLKYVQASCFYIRLFRPEKMHYERLVNPVSIHDGPVGEVQGFLDHFMFSKGITHWLDRHNYYSSFEAQQIIQNLANKESFSLYKTFFSKDFHQRRFHQKDAILQSIYEYMIVLKTRELLERRESPLKHK
jgi:glycosyltransferase involved in cell wall biosynthesis